MVAKRRDPAPAVPRAASGLSRASYQLPADVRSAMEHLLAETEWHLKECIDDESTARRKDVEALRQECASAVDATLPSFGRRERGESGPYSGSHEQELREWVLQVQRDAAAHDASQDARLQRLEDSLDTERAARKAFASEIQRNVLSEVAQAQDSGGRQVGVPEEVLAGIHTLEVKRLASGEATRHMEVRLAELEQSVGSLQSGLDERMVEFDVTMRRSEAHIDRLQRMTNTIKREISVPKLQRPPEQGQGLPTLLPGGASVRPGSERKETRVSSAEEAESHEESDEAEVAVHNVLDELEEGTFSPKAAPGRRRSGQERQGQGQGASGDTREEDEEEQLEVKLEIEYLFQASTWDACLFYGLHLSPAARPASQSRAQTRGHAAVKVSWGDSILLAMACLAGFITQLLFIGVVYTSLAGDPLQVESLEQLKLWRLFQAHAAENYDALTQTSLAARVCSGSLALTKAGRQSTTYSAMHSFLAGELTKDSASWAATLNGRTLCTACLLLWTASILSELKSTTRFARVLWRSVSREPTLLVVEAEGLRLERVNQARAAMLTVLVILPRLLVAFTLFPAGLNFLIYSLDLGELLLNALALAFIVTIDDMFYEVLVPVTVKAMQAKMLPVSLQSLSKSSARFRHVDYFAVLSFLVLILAIIPATIKLDSFVEKIRTASTILCSGDLDFVYTTDKGSNAIYISPTAPSDSLERLTPGGAYAYTEAAILNRTGLVGFLDPEMIDTLQISQESEPNLFAIGSTRDVLWLDAATSTETIGYHSCSDEANFMPRWKAASTAFFFATGVRPSDCEDLAPYCRGEHSARVRSLCPEICGCADPTVGLFNIAGCTLNCESRRAAAVQRASRNPRCGDVPAEALAKQRAWKNYWQEVTAYLGDQGMTEDLLDALNVSNFTQAAMDGGCDFASSLASASSIDPCCYRGGCRFGTVALVCGTTCSSCLPTGGVVSVVGHVVR